MRRYLRLLALQLKVSFVLAAQYRVDFLLDGAIEVLWTSTALAPLLVVFGLRTEVAGWRFGDALVVVGFFTLLQALLEGVMNPSYAALVEHVRKGTLDYVLLLPADAQFLISTARFHPWRSVNVITALGIFVVAFRSLGHAPSVAGVAVGALSFGAAAVMLHALWTLGMCSVFVAVRTQHVTDVMSAVLDASRWPSTVFRGATRLVLTFVVPLGLMTTVPARALLGSLDPPMLAAALSEALLLALVARVAWRRSLARYTSASS
ncbi:MAG: ABC transporter permease [Polyangiaceae bacterium]